jgi:hypothetical protein
MVYEKCAMHLGRPKRQRDLLIYSLLQPKQKASGTYMDSE